MKTIFLSSGEKMDSEARAAVRHAQELVEGKDGFRTLTGETWRGCTLVINPGHNINMTNIYLKSKDKAVLRRPDAFNTYAFYSNGVFWACVSCNQIELI